LLTSRIPLDPLERSIELLEGNKDPLQPPNTIDTRIAPEVSDVVMRAMEIKREGRFDSAMIMRQVLRTAVVKAKEREATEVQEMVEAAEVLRGTQPLKMPVRPPEPLKPAQPTEAEILAQRLREAEEMRLEAERRAAEAERLLREQESQTARLEELAKAAIHASSEPAKVAISDDDLLEISTEPIHASYPPLDDEIHLSIHPEPRAKIDLRSIAKAPEPARTKPAAFVEPVVLKAPESAKPAEPSGVQETKRPEPAVEIEEDEPFLLEIEAEPQPAVTPEPAVAAFEYSYDEPKRRGLPIPLIAGVGVAVLVVAVLGFVFLGGSSSGTPAETQTAVPQPEQPVVVEQPAEIQPEQPAAAFNEPSQTDQPQPEAEQPAAEQQPSEQRTAAQPAQTPKARAAQPAKTPAPKKPVTVDDLINDN
jgi:hypothetical protein